MVKRKTYSAYWQEDHTKIIFRHLPASQIRARLPREARVCPDTRSTLGRLDGGDEYEWAVFELDGQKIIVQRES